MPRTAPSALATVPREIPRHQYVLRQVVGLDLHDAPPDLAEGYCTQLDNIVVVGKRARVRPGKVGILATAFTNPVYCVLEYVVNGVSKLLVTQGGKLYSIIPPSSPGVGAATVTEITYANGASANVVSASLRADSVLAQGVPILITVDGTNNPPLYINPTTNKVQNAGGLNNPTVPIVASLTSTVLDTLANASQWQADSLVGSTANQVVNGMFTAGSGSNTYSAATTEMGWTNAGQSVDWHNNAGPGSNGVPGGYAGTWLLCDTPGDSIITTAGIANFAETLDSTRNATQFFVSYQALNTDGQGRGSIIIVVIAYDSGQNELGRVTQETAILGTGGQAKTYTGVFSFGDLGTPIATYKLQVINGIDNQNGDNSIYLTNVFSYPTVPVLSLTTAGGALLITSPSVLPTVDELYLNGIHIQHTFTTPLNLTQTETLAIGLGTNTAQLTGLSFYLRLQQTGQTAWYATNPVAINTAANIATVNITTATIPTAVLAACAKMEIVFNSDVTYTGPAQIVLGPLTAVGNLTDPDVFTGLSFLWQYTEINSEGDVTYAIILESNPAPESNALTPTPTQATASLVLPSGPLNSASDAFAIYRIGGVFPDGIGRLIAYEKWGTSDPTGSIAGNPYVKWNAGAHTFVDNTPDSYLLTQTVTMAYAHDPPPLGAQDVCVWQRRVCLAVGSNLYISSLSDYSPASALYFPLANLPNDPNAAINGLETGTGSAAPIVRLLAYGTNLVVDKGPTGGIYLGFGYNVNNFALQSYLLKSGVGSVAPGCLAMVRNHAWLLGPDGWYQFDADVADPTSQAIDVLLQPSIAGKIPLNAAAVKASRAVYHARRLLHFSPSFSGDTTNTVTHVYDTRQNGWTNWIIPATSGVSLSSAADTGACFLGGYDGQIYQLTGTADIPVPGGNAVPIPYAVSTRAVGQEGGGEAYYREKTVSRLFADVYTEEAAPGNATIGAAWEMGAYSFAWPLVPGAVGAGVTTAIRKQAPTWVRGHHFEITLSGNATGLLEIAALGMEVAEGRVK